MLKSCYPRWFLIWIPVSFVLSLIIFVGQRALYLKKSSDFPNVLIFITAFISIGGIWLFSFLFGVTIATNKGLFYLNPYRKDQVILWEEILEVKRPRFKIPEDLTYVFGKGEKRILLVRSMDNYKELVFKIKEKAKNLESCEY